MRVLLSKASKQARKRKRIPARKANNGDGRRCVLVIAATSAPGVENADEGRTLTASEAADEKNGRREKKDEKEGVTATLFILSLLRLRTKRRDSKDLLRVLLHPPAPLPHFPVAPSPFPSSSSVRPLSRSSPLPALQ